MQIIYIRRGVLQYAPTIKIQCRDRTLFCPYDNFKLYIILFYNIGRDSIY